MYEDLTMVDNADEKRYEVEVENHKAFIKYIIARDKIYLTHTEVPKQLGGKGVGRRLVELVLDHIESLEKKIIPNCPFVAAYLRKHPERQGLVAEGFTL